LKIDNLSKEKTNLNKEMIELKEKIKEVPKDQEKKNDKQHNPVRQTPGKSNGKPGKK